MDTLGSYIYKYVSLSFLEKFRETNVEIPMIVFFEFEKSLEVSKRIKKHF